MTDTPAFAEVLSRAIPADGTTLDAMRAALWDTPAGRTMINKGDVVLYWLNEADVARAALAAAPQPAPTETALDRLHEKLTNWRDKARQERPEDVPVWSMAINELLLARKTDAAPQPAVADREACRAKQAEPDRGFDETPYDRGYVWGYRHGLRDGKAEVAPQPATEDREALVEVLRPYVGAGMAHAIADALLARGLRLPDVVYHETASHDTQAPLPSTDDTQAETLAWAVVGEDGEILLNSVKKDRSKAERYIFDASERLVRVAIRVVEGGDDE